MMEREPIWVSEETVRAAHGRQLAEHGGSAGVRDEGLLLSALARPHTLFAYGEPAPDLAALETEMAEIYLVFLRLAEGSLAENELAQWLLDHLKRLENR